MNISEILKEGYSYVALKDLPKDDFTKLPVNLVSEDFEIPENLRANFFLKKNGKLEYAVINGFLIDLGNEKLDIENALILD